MPRTSEGSTRAYELPASLHLAVRCFRPVAARNRPSAAPRLLACDTPYCPPTYPVHGSLYYQAFLAFFFPEASANKKKMLRYRLPVSSVLSGRFTIIVFTVHPPPPPPSALHGHHTPWYHHIASCVRAASCEHALCNNAKSDHKHARHAPGDPLTRKQTWLICPIQCCHELHTYKQGYLKRSALPTPVPN